MSFQSFQPERLLLSELSVKLQDKVQNLLAQEAPTGDDLLLALVLSRVALELVVQAMAALAADVLTGQSADEFSDHEQQLEADAWNDLADKYNACMRK